MKAQHFAWVAFAGTVYVVLAGRGLITGRPADWAGYAAAVALVMLAVLITQVGKTGPIEWVAALTGIVLAMTVLTPDALPWVSDLIRNAGGK